MIQQLHEGIKNNKATKQIHQWFTKVNFCSEKIILYHVPKGNFNFSN
jgi:hypothetical protein